MPTYGGAEGGRHFGDLCHRSCAELESSGDIGRGGGGGSPGGAERGGDKQGRVVQMALMGPGGTV